MLVPIIRIVSDWLANGNGGADAVAALLPTVPREIGDALPATPTIDDMTRDGWVARMRATEDGATWACLSVWINDPIAIETPTADPNTPATVTVIVGYLARGELTQDEIRVGDYCVRAAIRSIARLARETAAATAARTRGEMIVEAIEGMQLQPPRPIPDSDVWVTASVAVTLKVRETKPEG